MTFKERVNRIREWCAHHKAEIAITAIGVAVGGGACYGLKKFNDHSNARLEELCQTREMSLEELEFGMFVNGIRKQFLDAENGETIPLITDSLETTRSIVQSEEALCGLRNGCKVLVAAQDIPAGRGVEVIEAVRHDIPGIDNLEIWIGGTIKE